MKKIISLTLVTTLFSLGLAGVVFAQHDGQAKRPAFFDADTDQDGRVSLEEFKKAREQHMTEHFKRVDTNQDGFIDQAEKTAAKEKWQAHHKERCHKHS